MSQTVKVGIVQASPVFMNLEASFAKAVSLIEEAARASIQLVTFGETWLPGDTAWLNYCPERSPLESPDDEISDERRMSKFAARFTFLFNEI